MESRFVLPRRLLPKLRTLVSNYRSWWFDVVRGVHTRATSADITDAVRDQSRGFWYLPSWPAAARSALSDLPIEDFSTYAFVDFGSGKGRVLLLAAAFPFRRILGVEIDQKLHEVAQANLLKYGNPNVKCRQITSLHMDAVEFEFPQDNMVLYFFNPFGEEIMQRVVARLEDSLEHQPRDVILIFIHPEYAYVVERSPKFRVLEKTESCYKYRARVASTTE